ncbi:MAG: hypothetical protein PGN26_14480 [Xylophilus ampelinus]
MNDQENEELMSKREDIMARIPDDLLEAHDLLHRYGRWAMDRYQKRRCASAEGRYVAPPNPNDRDGEEMLLATDPAMAAHRALIAVPEQERRVLQILYIPQRLPVEAQLRIHRIPARAARERHLLGVRMFWTQHMRLRHNVST